jgi:DNA polymerase I-like protein with 3'-5' exonuclease and polymerase domains
MKTPYRLLKSMADLPSITGPVFADTETCGLYGKIRLLQVYQEGWPEVLMVEWPSAMELAAWATLQHTVWHNAHYDLTCVQKQTGTRTVPPLFDDTFLLGRLHFAEQEKFSLDDIFVYVLGYDPYGRQGLDKATLQKSKWDVPKLSQDQLLYAATDVYYMPDVWNAVQGYRRTASYKLDMSTLRSCLDFQNNGMHVIYQALQDQYISNQLKIDEAAMPINVNSWQQVRPYIGEQESDDIALAKQALAGNVRSGEVRRVRGLIKQQSFIDKFDTTDGKIYGYFKPSARSGRLTSNNQNLQQIPRSLKKVFGYEPGSGRVLVYSDYAQLELRTICAITACRAMEQAFRDGRDLHSFTTDYLFKPLDSLIAELGDEEAAKKQYKAWRQLTKTYNFNLLYGGGVNMLISILVKTAGILLDERTANRDRTRWRNLWREIYAWQEVGINKWRKGALSSTPLGRKYRGKMMTDQLNIENQGAGAEVAKLALHYIKPELDKIEDVMIVNFIHDSFIIDCPDDSVVYEKVALIVAEGMQEAWFEMSKLFKIKDLPMPVDVAVGYNWGDIESDEPDLWNFTLEPYKMLEKVNAEV